MTQDITPIFLFSLPRSGSTLVQRILGYDPEIATVSEPWILLPYFYSLKKDGIYAEYGHGYSVQAIEDFCLELPQGKQDYLTELRALVLKLYQKAAKKKVRYFLDKTPRYHLIIEEIIALFPEAKFVILWRNPLAIVASIITTWNHGQWNIHRYRADLYQGIENLTNAYSKYADKIHVIQYENLLLNPEVEFKKLYDYLDLPFDVEILTKFSNLQLNGSKGDPTGVHQYQSISQQPLDKWQKIMVNPIRKRWCRRYLQWIGRERLNMMNYDLDQLLNELNIVPVQSSMLVADLSAIAFGVAENILEFRILKYKLKRISSGDKVYLHN